MTMSSPALAARQLEKRSRRATQPESAHAFTALLDVTGARMSFSRNEEIYGDSEAADYLYKVVSGAVRMYKVLVDGRRQIGAFYLPGDMFGFEPEDTKWPVAAAQAEKSSYRCRGKTSRIT